MKHGIQSGELTLRQDILYEAVVNLTTNSLVYNNAQDRLLHGPGDYEEVERVEKIVLGDPTVTAELAKLNLPDNTAIICEPWIYGKRYAGKPTPAKQAHVLISSYR